MKIKHILLLSLLAGCAVDPKEQAIIDLVEIKDGVRTDMNVKVTNLVQTGTVTGKDSAAIYMERLRNSANFEMVKHEREIESDQRFIELVRNSLAMRAELVKLKKSVELSRKELDFLRAEKWDSTKFSAEYENVKRYEAVSDSILCVRYKCHIKLTNPALGNTTQEADKIVYFNKFGELVLVVNPDSH